MADDLQELLDEAQEESERFKDSKSRIEVIKSELREGLETKLENEDLSQEEYEKGKKKLEKGDYGKVREILDNADGPGITLDDEDKQEFADHFTDAWKDLESKIEQMRTDLVAMRENGIDRDRAEDAIYGRNSKMTRKEVERIFDVIEEIEKTSIDTEALARLLRGFNSSISLKDGKAVISDLKDLSEEG